MNSSSRHPNHRPWIKICGLTDPDTALSCARLGADAVGLVFFDKSPRNVDFDQAARITAVLPEAVIPVGVFVDASYDRILKTVEECGLKGVQLHGDESPELVEKLKIAGLWVIKTLFAQKKPLIHDAALYHHASHILVEYGKGPLPGGNAESWNYAHCRDLNFSAKLVLAGGLDAGNVAHAIVQVHPTGVDVSSGVEKSPGIKDLEKVAAFIEAVKSTR